MDARQPFKKLCSSVLTGSNTTTAPALTLMVHNTAVTIAVRRRCITQLLISGGRTADNSGPSWLTPRSQRVRASLDVAAADIPAALHRYQPHVHRGSLGVTPALGLRQQLLQRMRQQLIRRGVLAPAHELAGGDLVEDCRQLMERADGTQDVVLEELHYALEA